MSLAFDVVFEALHGHKPYAWQRRLCAEVMEKGWPPVIAAPTGAGKTAVLDIALHHLASEGRSVGRRAPRRIVFAVDRRVVVDQAFDRAQCIQQRLELATDGPLAEMKVRLAGLSGDEQRPLHVEELRGGMPREDDWARTPTQPTILCTTVDQLGSRLFFRGYGVSPAMAPIHAGLLGNDTLIILDEAHLSAAFAETLKGVVALRSTSQRSLALPFAVTCLTATPRNPIDAFRLTEEERSEKAIKQRLTARKLARLVAPERSKAARSQAAMPEPETGSVAPDDGDEGTDTGRSPGPAPFVTAAKDVCAALGGTPTIAIVVNRVALARAILATLTPAALSDGAASEPPPHEAILLTGRVRPAERDEIIGRYRARLEGREKGDKPLFVVATQCIEAGADFDFDGLVTEIAPLDSLAQRFGRLARSGERDAKEAPAVIIALPDDLKASDDPVYGDRMKATWDWLQEKLPAPPSGKAGKRATKPEDEPRLDLGPDALARLIAADSESARRCCTDAPRPPVLRAADLDFWSMTNPTPHPDPHLPLYLHGDPRIAADVSIVWRADLVERDLVRGPDGADAEHASALDIVAAMPPRAGEALQLPIAAARRFLLGITRDHGADAPEREPDEDDRPDAAEHLVVRWRGRDSQIVGPRDIRPGDTLVVPSSYGGCDRFGWAPESTIAVDDIADRAAVAFAKRRLVVRVHPGLWPTIAPEAWSRIAEHLADGTARATCSWQWLERLGELSGDRDLVARLRTFERRTRRLAWPYRGPAGDMPGVVISAGPEAVETDDDDASSFTDRPQSLTAHSAAVQRQAIRYSRTLGIPADISEALSLAARHHDDGKRDRRFQDYLRSAAGSDPDTPGGELAKSGALRLREDDKRLRAAAGVPSPWRHEVLSARLFALGSAKLEQPDDMLDLALWLIGTHHGQGRPFFRHVDPWDDHEVPIGAETIPVGPGPHNLDFDWHGDAWADLFEILKRRYGYWGLAYLEAVLRLADHRASEWPEEPVDDGQISKEC